MEKRVVKKYFLSCCLFICCSFVVGQCFAVMSESTNYGSASCPAVIPGVNDIAEIIKRGYLRVAVSLPAPPYIWRDEKGKLHGYDYEVAKEIARKLGVRLKLVIVKRYDVNADLVKVVNEGRADISVAQLSVTLGRLRQVSFTAPYLNETLAVLIRRLYVQRNNITGDYSLLNKPGIIIGFVKGATEEFISKQLMPKATHRGYKTFAQALHGLSKGEVTVLLGDYYRFQYWLDKDARNFLKFQEIKLPEITDYVAIAVNFKRWRLLQWLDYFIKYNAKSKDGIFIALDHKYFGADAKAMH